MFPLGLLSLPSNKKFEEIVNSDRLPRSRNTHKHRLIITSFYYSKITPMNSDKLPYILIVDYANSIDETEIKCGDTEYGTTQ